MVDTYEMGTVPTTVKLHGERHEVLAAVFLPGGYGLLDSHVVIYRTGETFTVHYLVHDDDEQRSYLHQGTYELPTYAAAVTELERRVAAKILR